MQNSVTAVASGGVLQGLNKEVGPPRIAQLSYGLLRAEPYQPYRYPGHKRGKAILDSREGPSGERYVHVINYFIVKVSLSVRRSSICGDKTDRTKGKLVDPFHEYKIPYPIIHTIDLQELDAWNFYCEEIIYVSDKRAASHYPLTYEKNMSNNPKSLNFHFFLTRLTNINGQMLTKSIASWWICLSSERNSSSGAFEGSVTAKSSFISCFG